MTSVQQRSRDAISRESIHSNEKATARFYDRWLGGLGPFGAVGRMIFGVSGDIYSRPFIRAAGITPNDRILELGCGPGMILIKTHQLVGSLQPYLGLDISSVMVQRARENVALSRLEDKIFPLIGGTILPVASASVDIVLLSHLIKYLTDEQLSICFAECRRVLNNDGRLVLWEFAPVVLPIVSYLIARGAGALKLRSREQIQSILTNNGFRSFESFNIETPWVFWSNVALVARFD